MNNVNKRKIQSKVIWVTIFIGYLSIWLIPLFHKYQGKGKGVDEALKLPRDPTQFKWYVIPFLPIVLYFYFDELAKRNYSGVLAGLAFFL